MSRLTVRGFFKRLRWTDGRPLLSVIEPYRLRLFEQFFEGRDEDGELRYSLCLAGRGKKCWKSADLVLAATFCLVSDPAPGYDADASIVANDLDQARDDLSLAKKLVKANPVLLDRLTVRRDLIERKDGKGFLEVLAAGDVAGTHGKSRRFVGLDEIHAQKDWRLLEALQLDPHRHDAQMWITSYASLYHFAGAPLHDLVAIGKAGTDPRMLFSWYSGSYTTDPDVESLSPEAKANPSMASWNNPGYLAQQQRRLPGHVYRRLHLNEPGLPAGSAFQVEPVLSAIERGVLERPPDPTLEYQAAVDMSGGSYDDATLCVGHRDAAGRAIVDLLIDQGQRQPFDPRQAVQRFAKALKRYKVTTVVGDRYAGETFRAAFRDYRITYNVADVTASEAYEALEPALNGHRVVLPDVPKLEQQLLGLIWRGGKITHPNGEHDDWANAVALAVHGLLAEQDDHGPILLWSGHERFYDAGGTQRLTDQQIESDLANVLTLGSGPTLVEQFRNGTLSREAAERLVRAGRDSALPRQRTAPDWSHGRPWLNEGRS